MSKIEHECLSIVCPTCSAISGVPCRPRKNHAGRYQKPHKARIDCMIKCKKNSIQHDLGEIPNEEIIMQELKSIVKNIINSKGGIKEVDLALCIPVEILRKYKIEDVIQVINELEDEKEIVVVRYCLVAMPYREKIFLLPKNTVII